jgi:hypothetical protein
LLAGILLEMVSTIAFAIGVLGAAVALGWVLRRLLRIADGVGDIDNT